MWGLFCGLLAAIMFAGIAACAGCSGGGNDNTVQEPVGTGFECDVDLTYKDMDIQGHLTRLSAGTLTLDITSPKSLEGMTMQWDGETISIKMYGLSFGIDPADIPETALGKSLLDALDGIQSLKGNGQNPGSTLTDEGVLTKGNAVDGSFEILSDPETGSLLSLKIPSAGLTATFSNFQLKTT